MLLKIKGGRYSHLSRTFEIRDVNNNVMQFKNLTNGQEITKLNSHSLMNVELEAPSGAHKFILGGNNGRGGLYEIMVMD